MPFISGRIYRGQTRNRFISQMDTPAVMLGQDIANSSIVISETNM